MSSIKHTIAVLLAVGLAYIWLSTPALSYYSLQAFALSTLCFFITKRVYGSKIWHILPKAHSFEIVFISFAIVLLIGATGNSNSIFYPFAYIHLFFLVMTTRQNTAVVATLVTMLVHYALEPELTSTSIATFMTLPMMLLFFLFARRQYDDARLQQRILSVEEKEFSSLEQKEQSYENFLSNFLQPKLLIIKDMLETAIHRGESVDEQILDTQITLLATETEKLVTNLNSKADTKKIENILKS